MGLSLIKLKQMDQDVKSRNLESFEYSDSQHLESRRGWGVESSVIAG
jgi:hypothetical protein